MAATDMTINAQKVVAARRNHLNLLRKFAELLN